MKVLKDNYKNKNKDVKSLNNYDSYPKKIICENCDSELEYEKSDIKIGYFGCAYINCPCCKYNTDVAEENIILTKDNIEFPANFWHTCKENGAVDCCNNKEVKEYINQGISYLRDNKNEYYWNACRGNLFVGVLKIENDETYEIMVTNNYYNTSIYFESEDY